MIEHRSLKTSLLAIASCTALALTSARAHAEAVRVELPSCAETPYDDAELRRTLALELRQRGLDADGSFAQAGPVAQLELPECNAEQALRLDLRATSAGVVSREVELAGVPFEARARLLALLIAESLQAPVVAAPVPPELPLEHDAPGTLAGERAPPQAAASRPLRVGLAASGRSLVDGGHFFWGAEANGALALYGPVRAALELAWTRGEVASALGPFETDWWSAALGADVEYRGMIQLALGPRLSLAHVSLRGEPRPGVQTLDPSTTLLLLGVRARMGFELGGGWALALSLAAGHALNGTVFQSGGLPALALDDWLLSPGVGLALEL
jgi:hypothetical protein